MPYKTTRVLIACLFVFAATGSALAAPSSSDACSLLSQGQISTVVGAQVSAGTSMSPTFKGTCNWTASGVIVTLMLETSDQYQAAKKPNPVTQTVPAPGVGDDAFYAVISTMASMHTKKGTVAFKTTVYNSKISNDAREAMEKALATQVASEL